MPGDGLRWMDGESLWGPQLTRAVLNGSVPLSRVDDMVTRIVAAWYRVGQDDTSRWPPRPPEGDGGPNFSSFTDEEVGLLYPGSDDNETAIVNRFVDVRGTANDSHALLARKIAAEGTVLVENKGNALPLTSSILQGEDGDRARSQVSIAVVGEDAGSSDNPNACPDRSCNKGTYVTPTSRSKPRKL